MKNIYLIPTTKEQHSIVRKHTGLLLIQTPRKEYSGTKLNIYITNDEDIKEGDYFIESLGLPDSYLVHKLSKEWKDKESFYRRCAKVILTTDSDLIKDGVQAIDDEFLEWYVNNPSCEEVEVMTDAFTVKEMSMLPIGTGNFKYKIIIPKEELKQETLEEAAENNYPEGDVWTVEQAVVRRLAFMNGANWEAKKSYSEEDIRNAIDYGAELGLSDNIGNSFEWTKRKNEWFEQYKKK
jgi:hypothetical protein